MLKSEIIEKLAGVLKIKAEELQAKITSEKEEDITLPGGEFFTEDELKKRDSSKYIEGKDAGREMFIKDIKKDLGYDIDTKDINDILKHHESQIKTKYAKEPTDRIKELESDIEKIKSVHENEINQFKNQNETLLSQVKKQKVKNSLLSIMPKETTISSTAIITLFNSEHTIETEDEKEYVVKNGEKLKNPKTAEPLKLTDVFNDWIVKENYIKNGNGRGGDHEFGNKGLNGIKSIGDFQKHWQKENPDISFNDPKYSSDYTKWRKENKEVTA